MLGLGGLKDALVEMCLNSGVRSGLDPWGFGGHQRGQGVDLVRSWAWLSSGSWMQENLEDEPLKKIPDWGLGK